MFYLVKQRVLKYFITQSTASIIFYIFNNSFPGLLKKRQIGFSKFLDVFTHKTCSILHSTFESNRRPDSIVCIMTPRCHAAAEPDSAMLCFYVQCAYFKIEF